MGAVWAPPTPGSDPASQTVGGAAGDRPPGPIGHFPDRPGRLPPPPPAREGEGCPGWAGRPWPPTAGRLHPTARFVPSRPET